MIYFLNKNVDISNLVRTTRFWNNLHQVRLKSKDWKAKLFKDLGEKCILGAITPKCKDTK
jgi:hypothetical protein